LGVSVYIHLPYCVRKCSYCDFNTYAQPQFPEGPYVEALVRELAHAASRPAWQGREVDTLFFGGGTPSLFTPASIAVLVDSVDRLLGLSAHPEITLEANPGTLEGGGEAKLRSFREAGVNRLSIGVQSFSPRHLRKLGRIHAASDSEAAVDGARRAGFDNLSCDLIFAVPGQTSIEWRRDLQRLLDCAPDHVSTYSLTYEKGTLLTQQLDARRIVSVEEEEERAMYETAIETLDAAGFRHYEISNFARPGREARHNLAYWTWRDYLGLGAGAHGFHRLGSACGPWGERYANIRSPERYMKARDGEWADSREMLGRGAAMSEYVMLGLRLIDGFPTGAFEATFGCDPAAAFEEFSALQSGGFLEESGDRLKLSNEGLMLADSVITRLAASAPEA
jgi:oxygen-independent coproporphyrinogen-3 oxidase